MKLFKLKKLTKEEIQKLQEQPQEWDGMCYACVSECGSVGSEAFTQEISSWMDSNESIGITGNVVGEGGCLYGGSATYNFAEYSAAGEMTGQILSMPYTELQALPNWTIPLSLVVNGWADPGEAIANNSSMAQCALGAYGNWRADPNWIDFLQTYCNDTATTEQDPCEGFEDNSEATQGVEVWEFCTKCETESWPQDILDSTCTCCPSEIDTQITGSVTGSDSGIEGLPLQPNKGDLFKLKNEPIQKRLQKLAGIKKRG
tara:strand:+ start:221 stop:997 length:777 start_codon:yes stop_codon:yes gene_type:complete